MPGAGRATAARDTTTDPAKGGNFASISCEKWEVGAIIGHHGKTIKEFERVSGAHIHVDRTADRPAVKISGTVQAVAQARRYRTFYCFAAQRGSSSHASRTSMNAVHLSRMRA